MESELASCSFCAQAIFQLLDVKKTDNGLFTTEAFTPGESVEYCTYNRVIAKEIGNHMCGQKKSVKLQIARNILETARNQERALIRDSRSAPLVIDISNSIAKVVESYKLPDAKKRIALRRDFVTEELEKHKSNDVTAIVEDTG